MQKLGQLLSSTTSSATEYHEDLSYNPSTSSDPSISSEESYDMKKLKHPKFAYRGTTQSESTRAASNRMSHRKTNFLKVVIVGESNVGKTTLIENFQYKQVKKIQRPTVGADFTKKVVTLSNGQEVPLQIWDTAGQERFQSLSNTFYRGTDCCVIVFDLCDVQTYNRLKIWRENFEDSQGYDKNDDSKVPIILVGNKTDLPEHLREVSPEQVLLEWIDTGYATNYIETSAFTSQNVEQCFGIVASEARNYQISTQDRVHSKNELHQDIMQQLVNLQKKPVRCQQRNSEEIKGTPMLLSREQSMLIMSSDSDINIQESPPGYQTSFRLNRKHHFDETQPIEQSQGCCYFV